MADAYVARAGRLRRESCFGQMKTGRCVFGPQACSLFYTLCGAGLIVVVRGQCALLFNMAALRSSQRRDGVSVQSAMALT